MTTRKKQERHGASRTSLYKRYSNMIARCESPSHEFYRFYGARGVKVCPEWRASFKAYAAYVGEPPFPGAHLSRIDPTGNYEPGNVAWKSNVENLKTSRDVRRIVTHAGDMTLADAARDVGKHPDSVRQRVSGGMAPTHAIIIDRNVQKQIAIKYEQAPELRLSTIRTIAKNAGVTYQRLRARLADGMTVSAAIADIRASKHGEITAAARKLGITPTAIHGRMSRDGMSREEAMTTPARRKAA